MDYRLIGRRIREERKKLGLTQDALARKVGISVNFLSLIENGRNMSMETLAKLANAFGVSIDYLLCDVLVTGKDNITAQIENILSDFTMDEKLYFLNNARQYKALRNKMRTAAEAEK